MTEITKTEAIVLRKTKFSDSSLIVELFTKDYGKISAMLKGARSSKSKMGSKVDLINCVEIVFYKKESKDLQLVSEANLINHFIFIKADLDKLKFASAVCELLLKLIPEHEIHEKLFRGTIRILELMNTENNDALLLFTRYLLFFIKEIGFEISMDSCSSCGNTLIESQKNAFSYADGIICESCNQNKTLTYEFSEELFNLMKCLTSKINNLTYKKSQLENIVFIIEKFLIYHNSEFKGIKSLQIL